MTLRQRLKEALIVDPTLVVPQEQLQAHPGIVLTRFEYVGLTSSDLKKLEHKGMAMRGYTQNLFSTSEGFKVYGSGTQVRWVLLEGAKTYGTKSEKAGA